MKKNLKEIGKYIRAVRKKRGLKMSDLSDENISTSTISNIENGFEAVNDEKRIYLCEKLNLNYHQIPRLIEEEKEKKNGTLQTLEYIEKVIDLGNHREGLKRLRRVDLDSSYLKAVGYYLRGRAYIVRDRDDDKERAKRYFFEAVERIDQSSDGIKDVMNIKASCYNQIAQICYYANDLEGAVKYTDRGIESFKQHAKKSYLIFSLLINKVVYLNKLGYRDQATGILDELWNRRAEINHMDVIINMYDMQANFLIDSRMYTKAIQKARKGLEIAQINHRYNRVVELLLTIGKAYMEMGQYTEAEEAFTVALDLESLVKQKHLFLPIYTSLGKIYMMKGQVDQANQILSSAINVKTKNHHVDRYVDALVALADSFQQQGDLKKAFDLYQKGLQFAEKHGLLLQENDILFKMCLYYDNDKEKHYELLVKKLKNDVKLKNRKE